MPNHPTHPATVHLPIAFALLTTLLDTLTVLLQHPSTTSTFTSLYSTLGLTSIPLSLLPVLSYQTTRLTLLTSLPAVLTGAYELVPLIQSQGISSPKARVGIAHALMNDLVVGGMAWNWWTRGAREGFRASGGNLAVSLGLGGLGILISAGLGGQLVYQYGMGVGRGKKAPVKPAPNKDQ